MGADAAPFGVVVAPLLLVAGFVYLLCPLLPLERSWARLALFAAVWGTGLRYLGWRFFDTVLPATGSTAQLGWIYFCFAVELAAFGDALILYLGFLRTTDRRREADAHEERLRGAPAGSLPTVDVFIPTYSEPFDVLEKTIVGALSLDYPNFSVWVLDDGRRPWLKAFCEAKGVGYITRPDNAHAKAGNINHALKHTGADFVAIFDA